MGSASQSAPDPAVGRIASIDALRGFDMFWIVGGKTALVAVLAIFVSPLPDWLKYQLSHPDWEGFSAWDMIMPLFLFVVGAAMPMAFAKRREQGATTASIYWRVIRRVLVLWVLGMAVQGNLLVADQKWIHLFSNTLQAIAVGYLVASILLLHTPVVGQAIAAAALLIGYWLLMLCVPFGDHPAGTLEPTANLARHIDQWVLGPFRDGTTTYTWILSGMGFAATVLLGVLAGHLLRSAWSGWMKVFWLVAMGGMCLALGWFWAGGFDGLPWLGGATLVGSWRFPIIKHLFTSSMVLWAAGWSYLLLALFYLLIDVLRLRRAFFVFEVIGANAIFAYVSWNLFSASFENVAAKLLGALARYFKTLGDPMPAIGQALTPVGAVVVLWLVLYYMYRNRTFLRV